jgi:hypothetical protein
MESLEEAIQRADIVVLGAPHLVYRNVQISADNLVVDVFWGSVYNSGLEPRPLDSRYGNGMLERSRSVSTVVQKGLRISSRPR